ncbi:MAG: ABC transporter permease subunit [Firmicutes bacterium]|nr:ABC transporter permease subunit [Bacillota bacterium]
MKKLRTAIRVESLKAVRSKIFPITIGFFSFITAILGLMMLILKDPELARNTGLVGAKAQLIGEADWSSYFTFLALALAIGGLVGYGFIATWLFGREFSDDTAKDLLALPVSRSIIILAKFIVMFFWTILLFLIVVGVGLIAGNIVAIEGWSRPLFYKFFKQLAVSSIMAMASSTPVAFFASYSRGYLLPMGYVVFTVAFSQIAVVLGHGAYIPWAIPALYSGAAGVEQAHLGALSFLIVFITAIIGILITVLWWRYADHS